MCELVGEARKGMEGQGVRKGREGSGGQGRKGTRKERKGTRKGRERRKGNAERRETRKGETGGTRKGEEEEDGGANEARHVRRSFQGNPHLEQHHGHSTHIACGVFTINVNPRPIADGRGDHCLRGSVSVYVVR